MSSTACERSWIDYNDGGIASGGRISSDMYTMHAPDQSTPLLPDPSSMINDVCPLTMSQSTFVNLDSVASSGSDSSSNGLRANLIAWVVWLDVNTTVH